MSLKTKSCFDTNFVVTGSTRGCYYDNLRCCQWYKKKLASWYLKQRVVVMPTLSSLMMAGVVIKATLMLPLMTKLASQQLSIFNVFTQTHEFVVKNFMQVVPWKPHGIAVFVSNWLCHFMSDLFISFTNILQGCFIGTGAIIWLPQCHWSNSEEYV